MDSKNPIEIWINIVIIVSDPIFHKVYKLDEVLISNIFILINFIYWIKYFIKIFIIYYFKYN